MPYKPMPSKPVQGGPWKDMGVATYDNVNFAARYQAQNWGR